MSDDKHVNRRHFFREGLRELLKPLSKAVEYGCADRVLDRAPDTDARRRRDEEADDDKD